jgi:hypothetical protein
MADGTCTELDCTAAVVGRGLCRKHYMRWWRVNGGQLHRPKPDACTVDGCDSPVATRTWCSKHYARWKRHGDPEAPRSRRRQFGACLVDGCDQPQRKRGWCAAHYSQWRRTGAEPQPFKFKWAAERRCVVCGVEGWVGPRRTFCSGACQQMFQRWGSSRPTETSCARCGDVVPLGRTTSGRSRRSDVKLCRWCRSTRAPVSVSWLACRDGYWCSICGELVDLTVAWPDAKSPSVDHVLPRARGGSDEPDNLALAHLRCNQIKSDRVTGAA